VVRGRMTSEEDRLRSSGQGGDRDGEEGRSQDLSSGLPVASCGLGANSEKSKKQNKNSRHGKERNGQYGTDSTERNWVE
jgi:hypothetical protein